jgi:AcrR family transcriptional regulator
MTPSRPHWKRPPPSSLDAIWEVADDVLGPNGQVRLEDVSEATGIPRATVYYYFPGRDPFVQWVVHEELERAAELVVPGVELQAVAVLLFERWRARPSVARRLLDGVGDDGWEALVRCIAHATAGRRRVGRRDRVAAEALLGAILTSALSPSATAADVRRAASAMTSRG